jgi:ATP-binding cassette subfamily B (MDR/TAP) protein 1
VTSTFIFVLLQSLTCVIAGFVLAFVYEWRITLVAIGLVPFLVLGGAARNYFKIGLFKKIQIVHKGSEEMIMESLINIRTVISLNAEESIISKYY